MNDRGEQRECAPGDPDPEQVPALRTRAECDYDEREQRQSDQPRRDCDVPAWQWNLDENRVQSIP